MGNLKVVQITDALAKRKGISMFVQAKLVIDTLVNYMASSDGDICLAHVPRERLDENGTVKLIDVKQKEVSGYSFMLDRH